jgi:hypothetical protein
MTIHRKTETRLSWARSIALALALGATGAPFAGCGSDSNPTPPDAAPIVLPDGGADDAATSPDVAVSGDTGAPDAGIPSDAPTVDGSTSDATVADGSATDGPPGVPGCTTAKPTDGKSVEFLNACGPGTCYPFPNTRLTRLVGGVLPPLP